MQEENKLEMLQEENRILSEENQMLMKELRETLEELESYKNKFGNLSASKEGGRKMDFKKIIHESKEKIQDKIQDSLKDEKVKESVEKGKELSEKAKIKVREGSILAVDAFKSAKKVLFNKELKEKLKEEYEKQRKERQSNSDNEKN